MVVRHRVPAPARRAPRGFTLLEVLLASVIFLVVVGAIYVSYVGNTALFTQGERLTDLQQNARGALDLLAREIRLAGYMDVALPAPTAPVRSPNPIIIARSNLLVIRGDVTVSQVPMDVFYGVQNPPTAFCPAPAPPAPASPCLLRGTYTGANMGTGTYTLGGAGATWAVVAFNIQSVTFTYFDANNIPLIPTVPPALDGADVTVGFPALLTQNNYQQRGQVRRVVMTLTAADTRGALPYGGRAPVYMLWTDINIRNLEGI